jgi:hypothetical protein
MFHDAIPCEVGRMYGPRLSQSSKLRIADNSRFAGDKLTYALKFFLATQVFMNTHSPYQIPKASPKSFPIESVESF